MGTSDHEDAVELGIKLCGVPEWLPYVGRSLPMKYVASLNHFVGYCCEHTFLDLTSGLLIGSWGGLIECGDDLYKTPEHTYEKKSYIYQTLSVDEGLLNYAVCPTDHTYIASHPEWNNPKFIKALLWLGLLVKEADGAYRGVLDHMKKCDAKSEFGITVTEIPRWIAPILKTRSRIAPKLIEALHNMHVHPPIGAPAFLEGSIILGYKNDATQKPAAFLIQAQGAESAKPIEYEVFKSDCVCIWGNGTDQYLDERLLAYREIIRLSERLIGKSG